MGRKNPCKHASPCPFQVFRVLFGPAGQGLYPCSYSFAPSGLSLRSAYRGLYPRLCSSAPSGLSLRSAYRGLHPRLCSSAPSGLFDRTACKFTGRIFFLPCCWPSPEAVSLPSATKAFGDFTPAMRAGIYTILQVSYTILHASYTILHHSTLSYTILHYLTLLTICDTVRRVRV